MQSSKLTAALVAATLVAGATMSSASVAGEFYVAGKISASTFDHTIDRNTEGFVLPVPDSGSTSTADSTDFAGGVALGYQQNFGQDRFFAGVEGFYNFETGSSENINGVLVTEIDLDASFGARVLAGVNATDRLSLYAHGGLTFLDFDVRNSYTFAPPVRNASETEETFSFGFGASYKVSDHISVFGEYTQTTDADFDGIPEVAGDTGRVNPNDINLNAFSLGLKYAF